MNIHYEIVGSGNPIVFLHGWGANKDLMQPLVSLFSRQYQCVNLDLFGFGSTDEIKDYLNFDDYVEYFHLFLMEHQLENPILIAHSFGARLAILYANRYPVSALILTGAAGLKSKLTIKKRMKQYFHKHHFKMKGSYDYEHATPFLRKVFSAFNKNARGKRNVRVAFDAGVPDQIDYENLEEAVDKAEMLRRKNEWHKSLAKFTKNRNKEIW